MALQAKAIKGKIAAVGNIKKITKTMEMVAASKMRKAIEASLGSREYAISALEILVHLARERSVSHPMLEVRETGRILIVIVASNKGLAGGYNVNISRLVSNYRREHPDTEIDCITIGKQAERIAKRNQVHIVATFTDFKDFANGDDAFRVMSVVIDLFTRDMTYSKVMIAYTQFIKSLTYEPKLKSVVPINPETLYLMITDERLSGSEKKEMQKAKKLYQFEPSEQEVMNTVIPELMTAMMFQVMLDAYAAEHSSRMVAMQNATENSGALQDDLKLTYNKARQAAITQEIAEISAGANAMSN